MLGFSPFPAHRLLFIANVPYCIGPCDKRSRVLITLSRNDYVRSRLRHPVPPHPRLSPKTSGVAAILIALPPAIWCALFATAIAHNGENVRGSGSLDFPATRLGKLENHLSEGGLVWLGTTPPDCRTSLIVKMGEGRRERTSQDGCAISISPPPTGAGEADLRRLAGINKGFFARTDEGVERYPPFDTIGRSKRMTRMCKRPPMGPMRNDR